MVNDKSKALEPTGSYNSVAARAHTLFCSMKPLDNDTDNQSIYKALG